MSRIRISWLLCLVVCVTISSCQVLKSDQNNEHDASGNLTSISEMLDLFNLKRTIKLWPDIVAENIIVDNSNCSNDFEAYFEGLEQNRIWALKSNFLQIIFIIYLFENMFLGYLSLMRK